MSLLPGTRLGVYEITAQIGEGGMGQVYRATDTKLKRQVAIKTLPPSVAADPNRLARFQREAEVLASLNHPHIAALHGLEDVGGVKALVMELVDGEDLAQRLARGPIPVDEAVPIAKQIAEALEAAHERGIIHRDLKPANIKVRPDGTVKVLDFGLAKGTEPVGGGRDVMLSPTITAAAMTEAGVILRTAAYMSPEQARGRPVDKRSDVWAFGCVLCEMLTGKAAFVKDNVSDTLAAVLGADPDWSLLGPAAPPSLRLLVQRCLEKDRQRRIADMSTATFLMNEPQLAGPVVDAAKAMGPARRRPESSEPRRPRPARCHVGRQRHHRLCDRGGLNRSRTDLRNGGATTVLTRPDRERGEEDHAWPAFLPGRQAVLFTITAAGGINNAAIAVLDLETGAQKILLRGGSAPRYLPSGHLVYAAAGSLRAVAFNLERLEVSGTPVPVVPELLTTPSGAADFDVASDGTLVYVRGGLQEPARALAWVDRDGREEEIQGPVRAYQYLRISPDGTRAAIDVRDQERDIWIWELARRTLTRFTFDPSADRFPVWTHDGSRLLFSSERTKARNMFSQASDGTGVPEQLTRNTTTSDKAPTGVSPDGSWVIFRDGEPQAFDVSRLALGLDHRIEPIVHSLFSEQNGEVSPDGRWLAYQSNDAGRAEIWVRPFADVNGGTSQVSAGGGFQPLWSRDGREVFYRDLTGAVMRVAIERESGRAVAAPAKLFGAGQYYFGFGEAFGRTYDISRDGRRFLMIKHVALDQSSAPTILVIENWFEDLKRLVPTK